MPNTPEADAPRTANLRVKPAVMEDAQNPSGAYRLYEKAGMSAIYEVTVYEKHIPSAP
ncbi:hypothetical protein [Paenibacillus thermotolerans]|uniref:hypothetical protein n=1 Tax=Paenibacillus thermotolerans TaxID=3027807 RepID=UPI00236779CE|nr:MULTISPECIES: hypothetical protein [unclassified Paenibacillus]